MDTKDNPWSIFSEDELREAIRFYLLASNVCNNQAVQLANEAQKELDSRFANTKPKRTKTMQDPTEKIRRKMVAEINSVPTERELLEQQHGRVWDTNQLRADFEVLGFMAPFVVAKSKLTGHRGLLMFQYNPRFYFNWQEDN